MGISTIEDGFAPVSGYPVSRPLIVGRIAWDAMFVISGGLSEAELGLPHAVTVDGLAAASAAGARRTECESVVVWLTTPPW
ncbi:hypothetical protein [Actinomadura sp. 7K507]|uniref:hypothetical protein n=1 Tax=Actinomadura sp. 7K507 TaxID=2530365 RepID=UPI0010485A8F|nr:hypothetical protein [Actinomadura sp. 7K507]TDC98363.1 hypothetical protein E1285_00035 [Actinomadura sp. 7K507]